MLTKRKINDMYWGGYCDQTIRFIAEVDGGPNHREQRTNYLKQHVPICIDCRNANIMKALEYEVAAELGANVQQLFCHGGDITKEPRFGDALGVVMTRAAKRGIIDHGFQRWMFRQADKRGQDWPMLDKVPIEKEN